MPSRIPSSPAAPRPFFVHCEVCLGSTVVDAPPALARALLEARGWLRVGRRTRSATWYCAEHTLAARSASAPSAGERISGAHPIERPISTTAPA